MGDSPELVPKYDFIYSFARFRFILSKSTGLLNKMAADSQFIKPVMPDLFWYPVKQCPAESGLY